MLISTVLVRTGRVLVGAKSGGSTSPTVVLVGLVAWKTGLDVVLAGFFVEVWRAQVGGGKVLVGGLVEVVLEGSRKDGVVRVSLAKLRARPVKTRN